MILVLRFGNDPAEDELREVELFELARLLVLRGYRWTGNGTSSSHDGDRFISFEKELSLQEHLAPRDLEIKSPGR